MHVADVENTINPIPEPPPVTRATLPLTLKTFWSSKSGLLVSWDDMLDDELLDALERWLFNWVVRASAVYIGIEDRFYSKTYVVEKYAPDGNGI